MKAIDRSGRGLMALSLALALLLAGCSGTPAPVSSASPSETTSSYTSLNTSETTGTTTQTTNSILTQGTSTTRIKTTVPVKTTAAPTKAPTAPPTKAPTESAPPTASGAKGKNILLTYISDGKVSKEAFRASVGYIKNGKITDTLFESILLLPQPNFLYNYGDSDGGLAPHTKVVWQRYIDQMEFGSSLDALNEAAGEVKAATGKKDYKVEVYMSLFPPVKSVTNFGEVNGKNLNFSVPADRLAAVKWMIDEQIAKFKAKNYQHLKIGGFYWFPESINVASEKDLIQSVNDYIRSLNYQSMWIPYYKAEGFSDADTLKFDMAFMQANYFPGTDAPNAGGIERIESAAMLTKRRGMGLCLELSSATKEVAISGFKEYMKFGCNPDVGFMDRNAAYYMGGGAPLVQDLCESRNAYARSAYDELYQFIKDTLVKANVSIR